MLHNSLVGRHSQVSLSCSATLLISCALLFCVTGCSSNTSNAIASYGTISTVAGTGINGFSGNGGLATNAKLHDPACIALDSASDLFIGDSPEFDIRKVTASTGIITTYAGSQVAGYTGDTGPATLATMLGPSDCATDISGNLYITDKANNVIRKVNVATGIITTVAGNGYGAGSYTPTGGFSGDGGPALQAQMYEPFGVAVDIAGNIYISDSFNFRIRKVSVATGVITTIAGIGVGGYSGDGGLAVNAKIYYPEGLTVDSAGNVYFVDEAENDVRKITAATGIITTIAGMAGIPGTLSFEGGFSGDGGPATSAMLNGPIGIALDSAGNVYISDSGNDRIRKVNVSTGIIQTVVGNGLYGYAGDGGPATNAELIAPYGITIDSSDNMYIADYMNGVVRKVTPLP